MCQLAAKHDKDRKVQGQLHAPRWPSKPPTLNGMRLVIILNVMCKQDQTFLKIAHKWYIIRMLFKTKQSEPQNMAWTLSTAWS